MDQGSRTGLGDTHQAQSASVVQSDLGDEAVLDRLAGRREAENMARLQGDRDLVDRLMWRGYAGRDWDLFARTLAEYGFPVTRSWLRSAKIFAKCADVRLGGLMRRPMSDDDVAEVSMETVAVAIRGFRDTVLIPGRWDPSRGASLKTFFIGQCVLRFPNVYRRWVSEQSWFKGQSAVGVVRTELDEVRAAQDPVVDLQVKRAVKLARANPDLAIRALAGLGETHKEIAAQLGMTAKAVEMRLYRQRGRN